MARLSFGLQNTFVVLTLASVLIACSPQDKTAQATAPLPAMPVSVITLTPSNVPISTQAVAQTEGAKEIEVRPRVGGILLKRLFEEGAPIKAGQPMFMIDPEPFTVAVEQARAQVAQHKARIVQTQREAERLKGLLETQSISQREYDNAVSDQAFTQASLMQAEAMLREAELNLSYTKVTAPNSGIAGRFLLSEGALVAANTSLLTTIVQVSPIWVRFSLSESELKSLGGHLTPQQVEKVSLILSDNSEYPEAGKLNYTASSIDPLLGTQQLRAEFINADRQLLPGQFVKAKVTTGTREGVFLVPQNVVLTGDHGRFVYVAEKDSTGNTLAAVRPIQDSGWQGQHWVVTSGLQAGEQLIVDNLIKIRPGSAVQPQLASISTTVDKQ